MGLLSKVKKQAKSSQSQDVVQDTVVSNTTATVQQDTSNKEHSNLLKTRRPKREETVKVKIKNLFNTSTTERRLTNKAFVNYIVSSIISSHPIFTELFNHVEFYEGDSCYVTPDNFMFGDKFFKRPVDEALFICYRECFSVFLGNKVELDIDFQERSVTVSDLMKKKLMDFYSRLHKSLFYIVKQDFDTAILSYTMLRTPADLGLKFQQLQLSSDMYDALNDKYSMKKSTKYLNSTAWEHKSSQYYLSKLITSEKNTFLSFMKTFKDYLETNKPIDKNYEVAIYPLEHVSHNSRLNDPIQITVTADKLTFLCNKVKMEMLEDCYTNTLTEEFKLELEDELKTPKNTTYNNDDTNDNDFSSSQGHNMNQDGDINIDQGQNIFNNTFNDTNTLESATFGISESQDTDQDVDNTSNSLSTNELQNIKDNIKESIISQKEEQVSSNLPDPTRGLPNESLSSDVDTLITNMSQDQLQSYFGVDSPLKSFSEDEQQSMFSSDRGMIDNLNILNSMKQQLSKESLQDILSKSNPLLNNPKELQDKLLADNMGFSDLTTKQLEKHLDVSNLEHLDQLKDNLEQNKQEYLSNIINDKEFIESVLIQAISQYKQKHPNSEDTNQLASQLNSLRTSSSFEQELVSEYVKSFTNVSKPMPNEDFSVDNRSSDEILSDDNPNGSDSLSIDEQITSLEVLSQLDEEQLDTLYDNIEDITDIDQLMDYIKDTNLTKENQELQKLVDCYDDLVFNRDVTEALKHYSQDNSSHMQDIDHIDSVDDTIELNDTNAQYNDLQTITDKLKLKYKDNNILDEYIEMYYKNCELKQQLCHNMTESLIGNFNLNNNIRVDDTLFTKEEHGNFMHNAESFVERGYSLDGSILLNQALTLNTEMQAPPIWWKQAQKMLKAMTKKNQPSYLRPKKKYLYRDLIVPANVGSGLNEDIEQIVLWLDTSSSMTDFDLLVAKAVLKSSEKLFPKKVSAYSFTTVLKQLDVSSMSKVDFKVNARGGTDIGVVLDKIVEDYKSGKILNIIISDGGFAWYLISSRRNLYPKGKFMFIITDTRTHIESEIKKVQDKLGRKNMQYIIAEEPASNSNMIRWR